jgi:hypothetical protein
MPTPGRVWISDAHPWKGLDLMMPTSGRARSHLQRYYLGIVTQKSTHLKLEQG